VKEENNIFNQFKPSEKPGIPAGYFEQLQKELNQNITPSESQRKSSLKLVLYSVASVAAVLLLFFTLTQKENTTTPSVADIKEINTQEIDGYIEENIQNFDEELFVEAGYIASATPSAVENIDQQLDALDLDDISNYLSDDDDFTLEDF
jgi:hypothetical protein